MPKHAIYATRIDLKQKAREALIALLQPLLFDLNDLRMQVKQAHWNVKGMYFKPLHELFDDLQQGLLESIDDLAERIATLGGYASASARSTAAASRVPELPDLVDGAALLLALVERYAQLAKAVREASDRAADLGDDGSADLLTGLSRLLDKALWILDSHLSSGVVVRAKPVVPNA